MRTAVLTLLALLMFPGLASAQRYSVLPGVHQLPNDLVGYLEYLQDQQLESLKLFTDYLEERVEEKAVPEGVLLNVQAIYTEAQLKATADPNVKREKLAELTDIYSKREKLDASAPRNTWFGVDRVKLGNMMRTEFETFSKEAERTPKDPPRKK
ncbi:hypothetical protein ACYFX5_17275 [Bremerella sp. T1]|uniref:hypothetical protein n=1 Tax=Bremerella sp. TYQ1 TaxID=3119568 RepID=UPI001CCE318B|nr:hypothetical protein [Bremerella volcania]UBM34810.1 hypothetical protein LA756_19225 [Bremerella volcania]